MSGDCENRFDEIYDAALKLEPEKRAEFLQKACGEDAALRAEIESLLAYGERAGSFLEKPAMEEAATSTIGEPPTSQPRVIDRYHLLQKIGEGGMGEVWLSEQKAPVRRRVALKLVKAGMDTREVIARFESERQALALMDHPSIAKVFDAGSTPQGAPYFVMEYVAGAPITTYCDNHRLSTRDRVDLFMRVCEGVQHAHQKAIIHRDLKPSNILVVDVDGRPMPKIIDFGVAKALSQSLTAATLFTRVGAMIGTPEYMSPEQALSSGEDIDTRTDVYSLGVIFYELLAGVPPIDLRKIALDEFLRRLREDEPLKPSTKIRTQDAATSAEVARRRKVEPVMLSKQIRGDLDSIALKALEKDRSRRYGSPNEFAADLGRYLKNEAVLAVPPALAYRARKFARRYRAALVTACAFALVLIVAAAVSISQAVRATKQAREATVSRMLMAAAMNNDTQFDLAALVRIQAWRSGQSAEATGAVLSSLRANSRLLKYLPQPPTGAAFRIRLSPDGRTLLAIDRLSVIWLYDLVTGRRERVPIEHATDATFGPDGRILVASAWQNSLSLWQGNAGARGIELWREQTELWAKQGAGDVFFGAGARFLATLGARFDVSVWDVPGHRRLRGPLPFKGGNLHFCRDSNLLAYVPESSNGTHSLQVWDIETDYKQNLDLNSKGTYLPCALSFDGKTLAVSDLISLQLWDTSRAQRIGELTAAGDGSAFFDPAFSGDGRMLAAGIGEGIVVWDVASRRPIGEPLRGHTGMVLGVAFSPDRKTLVANTAGAVQLWDPKGQRSLAFVMQGHQDAVQSVAFSPDGRRLASASSDRTIRLWDTSTRQLICAPLEGHEATVWSVAFSPDGSILASASGDRTVRLWNALTGQALGAPLYGHSGGARSVAFSPNGNLLASAGTDGIVRFWDIAGRRLLGPPLTGHQGIVNAIVFSPDGKLLASGDDYGSVRLWTVATRQPFELLRGKGRALWSLAFSPNGKLLVAGASTGLQFWDVAHKTRLDVSAESQEPALGVAFSPDGRLLAVSSAPGVTLWDVARRRPLARELGEHAGGRVTGVAFSRDGKVLASGGWDKTVRLWDVSVDSWAARLCSIVNRKLSLAEWREFVGSTLPYERTCPMLPAGEGVEQR